MSRKLTIQEAETRYPDMIKGQTYISINTKYKFLCPIHVVYEQCFYSHVRSGCPECGRIKLSKSQSLGIEAAEKRFPDMVKGQSYTNSRAEYLFTCNYHEPYEQSFDSHSAGHGCPKCADLQSGSSQRLTTKQVYVRYKDLAKGQVYTNCSAKYWFTCPAGHPDYLQQFDSHRVAGCPVCWQTRQGQSRRLEIKVVEKRFPEMVKGQVYTSSMAKYWYKCSKGHPDYLQIYGVHASGAGCPACCESRGEKKVAGILESLGVIFDRQFRIPECRNSKSLPFDFDVWIKGKPFLIEFHGEQHYKPSNLFGKEKFKIQKHRDRIKKSFCKKNNIPLLVIKYTEKNIETAVRKFLRS